MQSTKNHWRKLIPSLAIFSGIIVGILGALLAWAGNPPNMGICIACFERDIDGALGFHRAALLQNLRPEIPAFILGAAIAAMFFKEWRGRSAAAPAASFLLGGLMMIGCLVFLGCPTRMVLRLGGGDMSALSGLAGFVAGAWAGVWQLRRGFTLGQPTLGSRWPGLVFPLAAIGLLLLIFLKPDFLFLSSKGPGSQAAPVFFSIVAGLCIGGLAQRGRLCFIGGIRDLTLIKNPHRLYGIAAILVAAIAANLILGRFQFGFSNQPIAHANYLWNFLGMSLVGWCAVLLEGCPLRQLVLAAQGDGGAFCVVAGMFAGAAVAQNINWAASPTGVPLGGQAAVIVGLVLCLATGWMLKET